MLLGEYCVTHRNSWASILQEEVQREDFLYLDLWFSPGVLVDNNKKGVEIVLQATFQNKGESQPAFVTQLLPM